MIQCCRLSDVTSATGAETSEARNTEIASEPTLQGTVMELLKLLLVMAMVLVSDQLEYCPVQGM